MRRGLYAILLATLFASTSQAGYVGSISLSSGSGASGSLTSSPDGPLVGTNLLAPSFTPAGGSPTAMTGYFNFSTGSQLTNDGNGDITYSSSGSNFFVLPTLEGSSPPPIASSLTTGIATQTNTGTQVNLGGTNYEVYSLTMSFTGAYLDQTITTAFNSPYAPLPDRLYYGSLTFDFVGPNISSLAGDQLISGTISFDVVPEPTSYAMVLIGGLGLVGLGRRGLRRAA